ncbi:MAG: hypothetical protein H6732_12930 [Alphaproteobacteria bacterium]|nr:hypothetical protein [Alphaproteobacteria bacterium]
MAHPDHVEPLDAFDRMTIRAYRAGLVLSAGGLLAAGGAALTERSGLPAAIALLAGIVLAVGNLHLYDKRIRWVVSWLAWSGLVLLGVSSLATLPRELSAVAYGLLLAALSALLIKEWFCFRIPVVRWTPVALVAAVVLSYLDQTQPAAVAHLLGGLGTGALAIAKLRMPLTHDLGDRSHYQI